MGLALTILGQNKVRKTSTTRWEQRPAQGMRLAAGQKAEALIPTLLPTDCDQGPVFTSAKTQQITRTGLQWDLPAPWVLRPQEIREKADRLGPWLLFCLFPALLLGLMKELHFCPERMVGDANKKPPEPRVVFVRKSQLELGVHLCGGNLHGVFVAEVEDDSPAKGPDGLVPGDLILEVSSGLSVCTSGFLVLRGREVGGNGGGGGAAKTFRLGTGVSLEGSARLLSAAGLFCRAWCLPLQVSCLMGAGL